MGSILKVYISSTYLDLVPEREAVKNAILRAGYLPVGMETDVARDDRPLDVCREKVASCDIYIGIIAWRYGFIPSGESKSITELEYEAAAGQTGIPKLIFRRTEQNIRNAEWVENTPALRAFRERDDENIYKRNFSNPDELEKEVYAALIDFQNRESRRQPELPRKKSPPTAKPTAPSKLADIQSPTQDKRMDMLSEALEAAYDLLDELLDCDQDTTAVRAEILSLKRQIRQGPLLKAGDFLLDGRFRLLERLGSGGFATIWKSTDRKRHEWVAIKVLHSQYAEDQTRRERFYFGARQMAKLPHQGIVQVHQEKLVDEGYHFFVMEYLEGGDFHKAVLKNTISVEARLRVIFAVGEALQFAHDHAVIHRDIKPANIVLDQWNRPKLTDFDLVRALDATSVTRTGTVLGTVVYAAPELLFRSKEAGPPADVYGLAMTTVFALYGHDLPEEALWDALGFVAGLEISQTIKSVLQRAVARKWQERYASVAEFCQALAAIQSVAQNSSSSIG